jgi:branched-chain amino acid transport system substrate-binding protein
MMVMRVRDGADIVRHRTLRHAQRASLVDGTNGRRRRTLLPVHEPGGPMGTQRTLRRTSFTVCVVTLLLAGLTFGATSRSTSRQSSSTQQGVTKDEIKIGIPLVDFDAIKDFVDYDFGDTEAISKVFVDDINKNGGINGRKIVPVYKKYPPIPGMKPDPLTLCTAFTEDDKVFAVVGVFIDFTGQGQECVSKQHNTVHIGHEIDQPFIDAVPGGLMLTPDRTKEHVATSLISLMSSTGKLKGKTVAVVGDKNNESRVNDVIMPALKKAKVKTGSPAILNITGTDTTAAQAQVDSFVEKWKTEGVNMVFLAGNLVSAKQFAESIKKGLPKAMLVTDTDTSLDQAKGEQDSGVKPNPYEGMISGMGVTQSQRWAKKNPSLQHCVDVYEKATGTTVPGPDERKTTAAGKSLNTDQAVTDACGDLTMFKSIAEKVGPNLTTKNWQKTVDSIGSIELPPNQFSSLCKGKYDAQDDFQLIAYDSSIGTSGDWKTLTPVKDASGGKCTKAAS